MVALCVVVVSATLASAAILKLLHPLQFSEVLAAFGVPPHRTRTASYVVPAVEFAIAVGMLVPPVRRVAAVAAVVLLVVFTAALGRVLRGGDERPECNCFGPLDRGEIGWHSIARNVVLIALAAVAALFPESGWNNIALAAVAAAAALGVVAFGVVRENHDLRGQLLAVERERMLIPVDRPQPSRGRLPGSSAPDFAMPALGGGAPITLTTCVERGVPTLLIFTDAECPTCRILLRFVAKWQAEREGLIATVLAASGDPAVLAEETGRLGVTNVGLDPERRVAVAFGSEKTPTAVLIGPDGHLMSDVLQNKDEMDVVIDILAERATTAAAPS